VEYANICRANWEREKCLGKYAKQVARANPGGLSGSETNARIHRLDKICLPEQG
jgi:hypothetical protein